MTAIAKYVNSNITCAFLLSWFTFIRNDYFLRCRFMSMVQRMLMDVALATSTQTGDIKHA